MTAGLDQMTAADPTTRSTWGEDLGAALLSVWLVGGVYLDGWAHLHRPAWRRSSPRGTPCSTAASPPWAAGWPPRRCAGDAPASRPAAGYRPATGWDCSEWECSSPAGSAI